MPVNEVWVMEYHTPRSRDWKMCWGFVYPTEKAALRELRYVLTHNLPDLKERYRVVRYVRGEDDKRNATTSASG